MLGLFDPPSNSESKSTKTSRLPEYRIRFSPPTSPKHDSTEQSPKPLEQAWEAYRAKPTPQGLRALTAQLTPVITKAVSAFAPEAPPTLIDRARLMAADAINGYDKQKGSLEAHVYSQLQTLRRVAPKVVDPMPISEHKRRERAELYGAIQQATDELGRDPSDEELAERTGRSLKQIRRARRLLRFGVSQSAFESGFGEDEAPDVIASTRTPQDDWFEAVYHDLPDRDKLIMQYRTGYLGAPKLSNTQIAQRLRIDPVVVSQRAALIQAKLDQYNG
jgi:DNA-directed RNA polymerase specialized sigma subunit